MIRDHLRSETALAPYAGLRCSHGIWKMARRPGALRTCGRPIAGSRQERVGGGRGAGTELSGRDEAKSLVRLRKMAIRNVYAGLRSFPPGRDWLPPAQEAELTRFLTFVERVRINMQSMAFLSIIPTPSPVLEHHLFHRRDLIKVFRPSIPSCRDMTQSQTRSATSKPARRRPPATGDR